MPEKAVSPLKETLNFDHSAQYWEDRYRLNGNSGAGSYGRLADFKAAVINQFVIANAIQSVIEFGCGDGNQLSLARYPQYIGFDVADQALRLCQARFNDDPTKTFLPVREWLGQQAELAISLDVIYHLIEEEVFERYMETLFAAATRHVIIYASNNEALNHLLGSHVKHVKHRQFTDWVSEHLGSNWQLDKHIPNRYPFNRHDQINTSFAEFFIFSRRA